MAKTNKHKAQGAPKKPVKESWWTPERVKAVISICVVLIIVAIGIGVYRYIDNKQDSVVGTWKTEFISGDTQEEMSIVFTFNAKNSEYKLTEFICTYKYIFLHINYDLYNR